MSDRDFDYLDGSLRNYIESLSAKTPVPGGGSAVACVASLSSSLIGMVLHYTFGKERYLAYGEELKRIKAENDDISMRLSDYIEKDSMIYENIRKHTKENPALAENFLKESAQMHLDICRKTLRLMIFAEILAVKGNKNLISDTAISAQLAIAAFRSGRINMLVNIKYIKDVKFCEEVLSEADIMEKDIENRNLSVYLESKEQLRDK
ncbi:MAG TPA: cyclodeaminase/cyclohydrolase family protein [bacterium]|nr:cyclodeaminase/cyclohydrolase family protein [bacterium]